MSNTRIKALIGFVNDDISMYVGEVRDVESTEAAKLISGGLAVAYTDPINPSGSIDITENGTYDVTAKASAVVAVPAPTGNLTVDANGTYDVTSKAGVVVNCSVVTITYDANVGTGSVDPVTDVKGKTITLDNGAGLTAPESKHFIGWGVTSEATETISEITLAENKTLYAIYALNE